MMPSPEWWIAAAIVASLMVYAVSGGADFGGGVWDLFARGPRAAAQRDLIARALAPIWEANHVWLILVVVLLFVCFPKAFAALSTALHIPLSLMLIGIVLRGSAFVFSTHDPRGGAAERRWSRVFAIACLVTPVTLGVTAGAIASGAIPASLGPRAVAGWFAPWLSPFALATGAFTVALFTLVAAVYLTLETRDPDLRDDFRRRALLAGVAVLGLAGVTLVLARSGAPILFAGLVHGSGRGVVFAAGAAALAVLVSLVRRHYAIARVAVIVATGLVVLGWGLAQLPWALPGQLTLHDAAAPAPVLRLTLAILLAGGIVLVPSLAWLFRIFKRAPSS